MVQYGIYQIINAKSGTSLDLSGTDQASIIGWPIHDGDNQKWYIEPTTDGRYTVKSVKTGQYISIDRHHGDGVRAVASSRAFEWEIKPDDGDDTAYRFFVPDTPFNLDLTNYGDPRGNTPVEIWGKWTGRNQCWRLRKV